MRQSNICLQYWRHKEEPVQEYPRLVSFSMKRGGCVEGLEAWLSARWGKSLAAAWWVGGLVGLPPLQLLNPKAECTLEGLLTSSPPPALAPCWWVSPICTKLIPPNKTQPRAILVVTILEWLDTVGPLVGCPHVLSMSTVPGLFERGCVPTTQTFYPHISSKYSLFAGPPPQLLCVAWRHSFGWCKCGAGGGGSFIINSWCWFTIFPQAWIKSSDIW